MRVLTVPSSISDMQNLLNFQTVALGPDWAIAVSFTIVSSYPVLLWQLGALLHDPCQMVAQCNNSEWQLLKEQREGVPKSIKSNIFFYRSLMAVRKAKDCAPNIVLYLPPASGILSLKVLQVNHWQPLHHRLSGIQRLQRHSKGWNSRASIFHVTVKYSSKLKNIMRWNWSKSDTIKSTRNIMKSKITTHNWIHNKC